MTRNFWKKQFEEHKFYFGYICGLLTWMLLLGLIIVISLITKFAMELGK